MKCTKKTANSCGYPGYCHLLSKGEKMGEPLYLAVRNVPEIIRATIKDCPYITQ